MRYANSSPMPSPAACVRARDPWQGPPLGSRGPVIKRVVDHWLRRMAPVVAFVSARPVDGGTGAVYVLLARQADRRD